MSRGRDQKSIARRIDLHYWKKAHPLRASRKIIVIACFFVAAAWMVIAYAFKTDGIYNPGHVSNAHAMIESNCAACHEPDPNNKGGFLMAVSDNACIACHEAPMHAASQMVREGDNAQNRLAMAVHVDEAAAHAKPAAAEAAPAPDATAAPAEGAVAPDTTAQPADGHHGGRMISAQCAACHIEHRGRNALAVLNDSHCTQCHEDLNKAVAPGRVPEMQNKIVSFAKDEHPAFGRRLPKDEQGNFVDPTKLKFNHKVHLVDQKLSDCSMCHTTWQPNLTRFRPGHADDKPPFKVEQDRKLAWAASSDSRYMQPVNYEQHCQTCHPIKISGVKGSFTHDKIEIVRDQVNAAFQQSATERYGADAPAAGKAGASKSKKPAGPADEGDWLKGELEKLNKNISAVQKSCAKCHEMEAQKSDIADASLSADKQLLRQWMSSQRQQPVIPAMLNGNEAPVEFAMQRRPGGAKKPAGAAATPPAEADAAPPKPGAAKSAAAAPAAKARKPIKPAELQTTVLTGISTAPRRWFAASQFDHRSHRDMACVDCHSRLDNADKIDGIEDEGIKALMTSFTTETKHMLSPGMDWTAYQFTQAGEGKWSVATKMRSCTECHRADTSSQRFTASTCVTCHAFHDHSQELYPDGLPQSKSQMAALAALPAPAPAPEPAAETPAESEPAPTTETPAAEPAPAEAPAPEPAPAVEEPAPAPEPAPAETAAPAEAPAAEAKPAEEPKPAPAAKPAARRPKTVAKPTPAEEAKPEEAKTEEPKAEEPKAEAEAKPEEPAPAEAAKPDEAKPADEAKTEEEKPAEAKPARKSRRPKTVTGS
jgi:hypothetical protein